MQEAVRTGLELGASELQVQRSNCSATLPQRCLDVQPRQTLHFDAKP